MDMFDITQEQWEEFKNRPYVLYAHCRLCAEELPPGESHNSYSEMVVIADPQSGMLMIGCKRHDVPVMATIISEDQRQHIETCGCEECKKGVGHA